MIEELKSHLVAGACGYRVITINAKHFSSLFWASLVIRLFFHFFLIIGSVVFSDPKIAIVVDPYIPIGRGC